MVTFARRLLSARRSRKGARGRLVNAQDRDRLALQGVFGQAPENSGGHVCARRIEHQFPIEHQLSALVPQTGPEPEGDVLGAPVQ